MSCPGVMNEKGETLVTKTSVEEVELRQRESQDLQSEMLAELKLIRMHLEQITSQEIKRGDV